MSKSAMEDTEKSSGKKRSRETEEINKGSKIPEYFKPFAISPSEDLKSVKVYDDCNEIRRKIRELLNTKTITKVALSECLRCSPALLKKFLEKDEIDLGMDSKIYPAAYLFFERMRIARGESKTNRRLQVEQKKPEGFPLERFRTAYIVPMGTSQAELNQMHKERIRQELLLDDE